MSPEPPAPRCSWQNAAGRNRDFSDLFSVHMLNLGVLSSTPIVQLDFSAGSLAFSLNCRAD